MIGQPSVMQKSIEPAPSRTCYLDVCLHVVTKPEKPRGSTGIDHRILKAEIPQNGAGNENPSGMCSICKLQLPSRMCLMCIPGQQLRKRFYILGLNSRSTLPLTHGCSLRSGTFVPINAQPLPHLQFLSLPCCSVDLKQCTVFRDPRFKRIFWCVFCLYFSNS